MGLASYYVWRDGGMKGATAGLYGGQLILNLAWQLIFFIAKRPGWAQVDNAGGFMGFGVGDRGLRVQEECW